jgi:hypothetical protein
MDDKIGVVPEVSDLTGICVIHKLVIEQSLREKKFPRRYRLDVKLEITSLKTPSLHSISCHRNTKL